MSITVSTDLYCDGDDCAARIMGATSRPWVSGMSIQFQINKTKEFAKRTGWKITSERHLCQDCIYKEKYQ